MDSIMSFGKSIREFESDNQTHIFTDAIQYPSFFNKHLVHPKRKIKVFKKDPNANIRIFYFQYLILCFQIENPNYQLYTNKIQSIVMDPTFTFLFLQEDDEQIFNDKQFKRFLLEFLDLLDCGEFQSVETALNTYPIMDIVFVYFFRTLIIFAEISEDFDTYIDRNILFSFFMESFKIDVAIFEDRCLKFFQSEIFLYEENQQQIYMVYKQLESEQQNCSNSFHTQDLSVSSSRKESINQNVSMLQDYENVSDKNQHVQIIEPAAQKIANKYHQNKNEVGYFKKNKEIQNNIVQINAKIPVEKTKPYESEKYEIKYQYMGEYDNKKTYYDKAQYQTNYNSHSNSNSHSNNYSYNHSNSDNHSNNYNSYKNQNKYENYGNQYVSTTQSKINRQGRTTRATTITGKDNQISPLNSHDLGVSRPSRRTNYVEDNIDIKVPTNKFETNSLTFPHIPSSFVTSASFQHSTSFHRQPGNISGNKQIMENQTGKLQSYNRIGMTRGSEPVSDSYKHPFADKIMQKLNVSKQFTDSLTLAKMGEPYKSHIKTIKNRSREFRQSLIQHSFQ